VGTENEYNFGCKRRQVTAITAAILTVAEKSAFTRAFVAGSTGKTDVSISELSTGESALIVLSSPQSTAIEG